MSSIVHPTRRFLLGATLLGGMALVAPRAVMAAGVDGAPGAVSAVTRLNAALLQVMKSGGSAPFSQRFEALAPVVDQTFDLQHILRISVGPHWSDMTPDEQARLLTAFRRYTIANYVANFDHWSGQTLSVDTPRDQGGATVVTTRISGGSDDPVVLGYVMQPTPDGWRVVDVLADGTISRVAVQRSDFRSVLTRGGGPALVASLQRKTADLSGGALA